MTKSQTKLQLSEAVLALVQAKEPTAGHYHDVMRALEAAYKDDTGHDCHASLVMIPAKASELRKPKLTVVAGGAV